MSHIKLSICIPTKNFGEYIGQTLDSIIDQIDDSVEILIYDGGSIDNTQEIISGYQNRYNGIKYIRKENAGGVDLDLAEAIKLASGRYCWPVSADDVIVPGAIKEILKEIESGYETYVINRIDCTIDLTPKRYRYWLDKTIDTAVYDFSKENEIKYYFKNSNSLGAVFSYISSIIFLKSFWNRVGIDKSFTGSYYLLAYTLLKSFKNGGYHKYIKKHLILCRGGNDSFLQPTDEGIIRRYHIDLNGFISIGQAMNYTNTVQDAFFSILGKEHPWYIWIRVAIRERDESTWNNLLDNLKLIGLTRFQILLIKYIRFIEKGFPVFKIIRTLRKSIKLHAK